MLKRNQTFDSHQVVQQCIQGNERAQKGLYDQYAGAMYHTIIRMMPYSADAEDVLQEVFMKVFQNIEHFEHKSTIGAWIKKICVNTTLKHLRKNNQTDYYANDELPETLESEDEEIQFDVSRIHEKIKLLPKGSRVVLNLYLFEGYKHNEIAQLLNISESTSKSQYQRGRMLLQKELKTKGR